MLSKNKIKYITSLQQKKYRIKEGKFIAEGVKIIKEILTQRKGCIDELYCIPSVKEEFDSFGVDLELVTEKEMKRISVLTTPQSALAIIDKNKLVREASANEFILMLDEVKDPGNLGTIIRLAEWFGVDKLICSEDTVDCYNPKVVQSTMGALFRVNIEYCNLVNYLKLLDDRYEVCGAFLDGDNIYTSEIERPMVLIMGNESNGISDELSKYITKRVHIPSFSKGTGSESLNVAIATGILCSEIQRNGLYSK